MTDFQPLDPDRGCAEAGHPGPTVMRLEAPTADQAELVAGWSRSADEAWRWVSNRVHPFPAESVATWWQWSDVEPWLLIDPSGVPVAYGEIWDDAEEDEVELARLIVDPHRRRQGIGTLLVERLLVRARCSGRTDCFLRVAPDNVGALALYRAVGFRDVEPAEAMAWNDQQPVAYLWLQQPLHSTAGPGTL